MRELALFAGAGGGILGSVLLGHTVVAAVEIDPYCREVLLRRQRDGVLPVFPIWGDVRTFDGREWRGVVDLVSAGFPCPPFSSAGKRRGADDPKNLWPETIRVIREAAPDWVLLENVSGLLADKYFGRVLGDLATSGYMGSWDCFAASGISAPHRRDRLWIVAHAIGDGREQSPKVLQRRPTIASPRCEDLAHADGRGLALGQEQYGQPHKDPADRDTRGEHSDRCDDDSLGNSDGQPQETQRFVHQEHCAESRRTRAWSGCWWARDPAEASEPQSAVGRVAHGVAYRVDRLRAIGNGQVPGVVARAWEELK